MLKNSHEINRDQFQFCGSVAKKKTSLSHHLLCFDAKAKAQVGSCLRMMDSTLHDYLTLIINENIRDS